MRTSLIQTIDSKVVQKFYQK